MSFLYRVTGNDAPLTSKKGKTAEFLSLTCTTSCTEMLVFTMAQTAALLERKLADMSMQEKMLHKTYTLYR